MLCYCCHTLLEEACCKNAYHKDNVCKLYKSARSCKGMYNVSAVIVSQ